MHAGDALDAVDAVEQEFLESFHVADDDLELIVRILAGNQQALHHFRHLADFGFEAFEALRRVGVHGDVDQRGECVTQSLFVEQGAVALNDAALFQGANPSQAGRGREANAVGQVLVAEAAFLL